MAVIKICHIKRVICLESLFAAQVHFMNAMTVDTRWKAHSWGGLIVSWLFQYLRWQNQNTIYLYTQPLSAMTLMSFSWWNPDYQICPKSTCWLVLCEKIFLEFFADKQGERTWDTCMNIPPPPQMFDLDLCKVNALCWMANNRNSRFFVLSIFHGSEQWLGEGWGCIYACVSRLLPACRLTKTLFRKEELACAL